MEAIVFILQTFFATCTVLKIGEFSGIFGNILSHDAFRPVMCKKKYLINCSYTD